MTGEIVFAVFVIIPICFLVVLLVISKGGLGEDKLEDKNGEHNNKK